VVFFAAALEEKEVADIASEKINSVFCTNFFLL